MHATRKLLTPVSLLAVAGVSSVVCVVALRNNYTHMVSLREAVYQADKDGADVKARLGDLQAYVHDHMNTNLSRGSDSVYPPIQLKYTYDRLVQAESARVAQSNAQLYTEAQNYCQQVNPNDFSGRNRIPCISEYVASKGIKNQAIPDALYKFSFASPRWSPDLAGWSMVVAVLSGVAGIGLILYRGFRK